jgi:molybdate transport system substrate-binding protein
MNTRKGARKLAALAALLCIACTTAQAAEVRVLSSKAFQGAFEEQLPIFERSSGHSLRAEFGGSAPMADRVRNGEVADVFFGVRHDIDTLLAAGKLQPDSVVDLAGVSLGLAVRKGAPKPDISTRDSLKRVLLAAKGITYADPAAGAPSAIHLLKIAEQLGISDELKARTRRPAGSDGPGLTMVANGEADLALQQTSELALMPGVELLGPLPPEFQLVTIESAGVLVSARQPAAGRALIRYLQTPAAVTAMQRRGLAPLAGKPQ